MSWNLSVIQVSVDSESQPSFLKYLRSSVFSCKKRSGKPLLSISTNCGRGALNPPRNAKSILSPFLSNTGKGFTSFTYDCDDELSPDGFKAEHPVRYKRSRTTAGNKNRSFIIKRFLV